MKAGVGRWQTSDCVEDRVCNKHPTHLLNVLPPPLGRLVPLATKGSLFSCSSTSTLNSARTGHADP
jgi:hypothetical protein